MIFRKLSIPERRGIGDPRVLRTRTDIGAGAAGLPTLTVFFSRSSVSFFSSERRGRFQGTGSFRSCGSVIQSSSCFSFLSERIVPVTPEIPIFFVFFQSFLDLFVGLLRSLLNQLIQIVFPKCLHSLIPVSVGFLSGESSPSSTVAGSLRFWAKLCGMPSGLIPFPGEVSTNTAFSGNRNILSWKNRKRKSLKNENRDFS